MTETAAATPSVPASPADSAEDRGLPAVGDAAPDFELSDQFGQAVRLADFRGRSPVVLAFVPVAFTGTCTGEFCELRDNLGMFQEAGVELIGISVDNKASLRIWGEREGYDFTLLSDFWPHGAVSRRYGVFLEDKGFANRATFVIDSDGIIRARFVTAPSQARSIAAYREVLAALR